MGALPAHHESLERDLPDYLPARMVNEFVYCPRLFFYEWVDGVFRESVDTVEGKFQHKRVDASPNATRSAPRPRRPAWVVPMPSVLLARERRPSILFLLNGLSANWTLELRWSGIPPISGLRVVRPKRWIYKSESA